MKYITKFVGLDVSKDKISVAVADAGREAPRFVGHYPHKLEAVKKIMRQLGAAEELEVCYEAGPTGYVLFHWLTAMGITCRVVVPTLIPVRAGDQVKTDKRDALRLAQLLRAGELVDVHVPTPDQEALRDLVRAREDAKEDLHRDRQRILKLLLRRQIAPPIHVKGRWTRSYREWLNQLTWERETDRVLFKEYLQALDESETRLKRLEKAITEHAEKGTLGPIVKALQVLRGVGVVTAVTLTAEIGSFRRFRKPAMLMAYLGLVPREHSTGLSTRRGSITKTGNTHARRVLVESSWSYRHTPSVGRVLQRRMADQPGELCAISWRAQTRLHAKYLKMMGKGKAKNVAITAVAREFIGFIWEVACAAEAAMEAKA